MKSICVTGFSGVDNEAVYQVLQQAGLLAASPARHGEQLDMQAWHQRVLDASASTSKPAERQLLSRPGRLWEQLASDVFLANLEQPLWGWQDWRSGWLLEFWLEFETNIHFVLVYAAPERALEAFLTEFDGEMTTATLEQFFEQWQVYYQHLLRLHHRHAERCVLVEAGVAENPAELVAKLAGDWDVPLEWNEEQDELSISVAQPSPLQALVGQYCETDQALLALKYELEASLSVAVAVAIENESESGETVFANEQASGLLALMQGGMQFC